jgi:nucleoside-diphosphate-sugar epimerase
MRIAITGATGHLGQAMVWYLTRQSVDVFLVGRRVPEYMRADAVFHLAAPNHRDEHACTQFTYFNEDLWTWADQHSVPVINTGTWWQHAGVDAESLTYTVTKAAQQAMFKQHTTLTLFSVYGNPVRDGRGFVPQLIGHLQGTHRLAGASTQVRDWIYTEDVCRAYMAALKAPVGVYDVCTYLPISPMRLAQVFTDEPIPTYVEDVDALVQYPNQRLPKWRATTAVTAFIAQALERQAA